MMHCGAAFLTGMMVKMKQQHVGDKTNNEPNRSFEDSHESWSHDERIP